MAENKTGPTEPEQKKFYKETLERQVAISKQTIANLRQTIATAEIDLQQNVGILKYAEHLLREFELPKQPAEPKKPNLEVK